MTYQSSDITATGDHMIDYTRYTGISRHRHDDDSLSLSLTRHQDYIIIFLIIKCYNAAIDNHEYMSTTGNAILLLISL